MLEQSAGFGMQPRSGWLLDFAVWGLTHRPVQAMRWYNRLFLPLGLLLQKPLAWAPGLTRRREGGRAPARLPAAPASRDEPLARRGRPRLEATPQNASAACELRVEAKAAHRLGRRCVVPDVLEHQPLRGTLAYEALEGAHRGGEGSGVSAAVCGIEPAGVRIS